MKQTIKNRFLKQIHIIHYPPTPTSHVHLSMEREVPSLNLVLKNSVTCGTFWMLTTRFEEFQQVQQNETIKDKWKIKCRTLFM